MILTVTLFTIAIAVGVFFFIPFSDFEGNPETKHKKPLATAAIVLASLGLLSSTITIVPTAHVGVVKTFGKVSHDTLPEGLHFTYPWDNVIAIYTGMDVSEVTDGQAASKDMQSVASDIVVNFYVDPKFASDFYQINPNLQYRTAFVFSSTAEIFKAVVSNYDAEELITKRQQVSDTIVKNLNARLAQYHIKVQTVNMVNFGFSKAFDAAIEEKVTASQKAETAKRDLERIKYEAESRVAAAEGEAKAIAIQAAAIDKQGGAAYVQLKAVERWDGQLPAYMSSGAVTPFVQLK